jgi:CheY-like chemotaxis protein
MTEEQKTILVVEDEEETAELFKEILNISGYKVVNSTHTHQAIEIIKEINPNAIILDVMMPDASGLAVLEFLKKDPKLADTPVIVVSAKALPEDIKIGLEAGAVKYLTKPVSYNDLKGAVEEALGVAGS